MIRNLYNFRIKSIIIDLLKIKGWMINKNYKENNKSKTQLRVD